jgi:hypothetical protein
MNSPSPTEPATAALVLPGRLKAGAWCGALGVMVLAVAAGGCVSVKAPDKPIVIELNVNIRQEVVYRLAEDAGNTIKSNPDIF